MEVEGVIKLFEEFGGGGSYGGLPFEIPFDIISGEFIKYAKEDFKEGEKTHNLVNALSNVKRAIECQMDCIIASMGYLDKSKKNNWNIPKKIEFIGDLGIVAPMILHKIGTKRNLLEHEYKKPTKEEVQDALGVGELFIAYAEKLQNWCPQSYKQGGVEEYVEAEFSCEEGKNAIRGKFIVKTKAKSSKKEKVIFETVAGEENYDKLLRYILDKVTPIPSLR